MAKRGRPTKEPTADERAKVTELLANNAPLSDVAKLLGYSLPTLRKYFHTEIFFGKKIKEPDRPVRIVTADMREKVKRYVGTGIKPEKVALLFGYLTANDYDEFKDAFATELMIADVAIRAMIVDRLHEQSKGGMIGATNKLEALTQISDPDDSPQSANPGYIGKKTAAKADADAAVSTGSKFAPRSSPRLAAVNGQSVGKPD